MKQFDALTKNYSSEEVNLLVEAFIEDLSFWETSSSKSKETKQIIDRIIASDETKRKADVRRKKRKPQRRDKDQNGDPSEPLSPEPLQEPSNWRTAVDPMSRKIYYYDTITRRTQWEKPEEVEIFEMKQKREFRRQQKIFFREMEARLMDSLARGEVMPGISRENVKKAGPPKEPILITASSAKVRTISCMNEELLAELQSRDGDEGEIPFPVVNVGVGNVIVGDGRSNGRLSSCGPPHSSFEGRPPLPHRRPASSASSHLEPTGRPSIIKDTEFSKLDSMELSPEPSNMKSDAIDTPSSIDNDLLEGEHLLDDPVFSEDKCKTFITNASTANQVSPKRKSNNSTGVTRPNAVTLHSRRNTGGTIFVKSTMENPDIEATIKCICGIVRVHIIESTSKPRPGPTELYDLPPYQQRIDMDIFRDDYTGSPTYGHKPSEKPNRKTNNSVPSLIEIESFFRRFFERSQMEHDTLIMSLIYVEKLIKETNGRVSPTPQTWKSILFACMILASKVWDDLSMWNVDFSNVVMSSNTQSQFTLKKINELEFSVLSCLNFSVKVTASEYAKYYYIIREMMAKSGLMERADSLSKKQDTQFVDSLKNQSPQIVRPERNRARSFDLNYLTPQKEHVGPDSVCLEQLLISLKR